MNEAESPIARITSDSDLTGETRGAIVVESRSTLMLWGVHTGPIDVEGGSLLVVRGTLNGALSVASLATVEVFGTVIGPVDVKVAGTLVIDVGGVVQGEVANYGSLTNRGTRSADVTGRVPDDQPGSSVNPPSERRG